MSGVLNFARRWHFIRMAELEWQRFVNLVKWKANEKGYVTLTSELEKDMLFTVRVRWTTIDEKLIKDTYLAVWDEDSYHMFTLGLTNEIEFLKMLP